MQESTVGMREGQELLPIIRKTITVRVTLEDDHFIVRVDVAGGNLVCHTLTEVSRRLQPLLKKVFPLKSLAYVPQKKATSGLPQTPKESTPFAEKA